MPWPHDLAGAAGVTIESLGITFGGTPVLKDVNLRIEAGEFFAFLGPSGSGKSTLLRAIAGFGPAPAGRILIGGDDVTRVPPWRRQVGMVFQNYALWPHLTVRRNVAFGLEEQRLPAAEIRERVDAALRLVGLLDLAERRPSQLSGGQQQRVALARTIVIRPRVLLLDEPLSNLDANLRVQMRREIHDLQRALKLTTVFVTHDQEEANTVSDRMAVLDRGAIQQVGTPRELYDRPANRFVAGFLGTANLIDGRIERRNTDAVFVADGGIAIPVADPGVASGAGHTILFRPQSLIVTGPEQAAPAAGGPPRIRLAGTVEHKEFLGGHVRYSVRVGNHAVAVDASHVPGQPDREVGEAVALHLAPDQVRVLPA